MKFTHTKFAIGLCALLLSNMPTLSAKGFIQKNLVSDIPGNARYDDPDVVNSWGLTFDANNREVVVALNGSGFVKSFRKDGKPGQLKFTVDAGTGIERNDSKAFRFTVGPDTYRAEYLIASEDGTISAFNKDASLVNSFIVYTAPNGVYKGLALADERIYAANFRSGFVDVLDGSFNFLFSFTDANLPEGYAPFNARAFDDFLYVTFALQDEFKHDDVKGPGHGFVDIFTRDGRLVRRLISRGALNSPWGLEITPWCINCRRGALLVGNFGDGKINAYDPLTGRRIGQLFTPNFQPLVIDGLWGIRYPKGAHKLFFAAGTNGEADGTIGFIFQNIE